jgi:hypothetical protein
MIATARICTILLLSTTRIVTAFSSRVVVDAVVLPIPFGTKAKIVTHMSRFDDMDYNDGDPTPATMLDLERARAIFERLVTPQLVREAVDSSMTTTTASTTSESSCYPHYIPPPLTEGSKRRRALEIQLLASMVDSDDAIDELMSLWMTERDAEATSRLQDMEDNCSPGLVQEEQALQQMIATQNMEWAEPMSRLATVYYYQGHTEMAQQWCQIVLAVKPWHFEVGHTLVLLALRRQDLGQALHYRRSVCLPPLNEASNHRRRRAWVARAIQSAQQMMHRAMQAHEDLITTASTTTTPGQAGTSSSSSSNGVGTMRASQDVEYWQ